MCNLANVTKDSLGRIAPEGPRKFTWVNGLEPPFIVLQEIDLAIEALKLNSEEMVYFPDSATVHITIKQKTGVGLNVIYI